MMERALQLEIYDAREEYEERNAPCPSVGFTLQAHTKFSDLGDD
jgi:hypothetical protein